eukprot:8634507-Karenia_brevis.AAC.1
MWHSEGGESTEPEPEEDPDPWQQQQERLSSTNITEHIVRWPAETQMQQRVMSVVSDQLEKARTARTKEAHKEFKAWLEDSLKVGGKGAHQASKYIEEQE